MVDSMRRRFSSNASTVVLMESDSPGADGRRPTISRPIAISTSSLIGPLLPLDGETSPPDSEHSTAASSTYVLAPEYAQDPEYRPFPTMADLCEEMGLLYPL
jgi:hypothetical protein